MCDAEGSARRRLVRNQSEGEPAPRERREPAARRRPAYGVIGDATCMGDHKPIYLRVMLQSDRGTLECCSALFPCALCACAARLPSTLSLLPLLPLSPPRRLPRLPTDPDLYASKKIKLPDISISHPGKFTDEFRRTRTGSLNETMLRIPHVEITSADYSSYDGVYVNDIDNTLLCVRRCVDPYTPESIDSHSPNLEASFGSVASVQVTEISTKLNRDTSVSPTQLKSRLDKLLNDKDEKVKVIPELQRLNSRESCKSEASKKGLCCLALKCYGFCRRRARKVKCDCSGFTKCCS